jgi:hypothetical protein
MEIFIRFYNRPQDRYRPSNPEEFAIKIIDKFKSFMNELEYGT